MADIEELHYSGSSGGGLSLGNPLAIGCGALVAICVGLAIGAGVAWTVRTDALREREDAIGRLESDLASRESTIAAKEGQIALQDGLIADLQLRLGELDKAVDDYKRRLAEKGAESEADRVARRTLEDAVKRAEGALGEARSAIQIALTEEQQRAYEIDMLVAKDAICIGKLWRGREEACKDAVTRAFGSSAVRGEFEHCVQDSGASFVVTDEAGRTSYNRTVPLGPELTGSYVSWCGR